MLSPVWGLAGRFNPKSLQLSSALQSCLGAQEHSAAMPILPQQQHRFG